MKSIGIRMSLVLGLLSGGCATPMPSRPCTQGGQPAHESAATGAPPVNGQSGGSTHKRVNKQCFQRKTPQGEWVNDGPYIEWHPNGKRWLTGEYKMGLKHDKWEEWDPSGKLLKTQYFQDGKEVPRFETRLKPKADSSSGSP